MAEHEGDDGGRGGGAFFDGRLVDGLCNGVGRLSDRCRGDFPGSGVLEAELADTIAIAGSYRRPEGPAGVRAGSIEIAGTVLGIESGAGLIVGEVLEGRAGLACLIERERA